MTLAGTWNLDPSHSHIGFTVRHAGIAKVRGSFTDLTAQAVATEDGNIHVTATINASSFTTGSPDRDAHIKSPDFLEVDTYPTLTFFGEVKDGELQGDITIHGVTRPINFEVEIEGEATDPFGNRRLGAEAEATINRKDFGLTWNAALETGGVLVSDKVKLHLDLSFIKG